MKFEIRPAQRKLAKLRLALTGVAGSGKSRGAIMLAKGMSPDKKFVVIDTERRSADLYAHLANFDVLSLDKPYTPEKYIAAIHYCEEMDYDVIIIDSLTHAWAGEGGALEMHDKITQASTSKNSYMAWGKITPLQNRLIDSMLQSPSHIIVTMRSKTHYEVIDRKPVKMSLAPIQREGMDYEFTVVLDIDKESKLYTASKDRTEIFEGKNEKISQETGMEIMEWLNCGLSDDELASEIERQKQNEIVEIKNKLTFADSMEALRQEYNIGKRKYPDCETDFTALAQQRRQELTTTTNAEVH